MVVRRRPKEEGEEPQPSEDKERLLTAEGWRRRIIEAYGKPPLPEQVEKSK